MSKKQNPYHLWLGLPAEAVSPDFFQLLGIDRNATDNQQIAATARTNAQRLLDRLKQVPVKSDGEKAIRETLKTRIVTAHKTISDPAKRKQYADALAAKSSASGVLPVAAPPVPPTAPPPPPVAASPNTPSPPSDTPANIPQAIPMAMPIDSAPQQAEAGSSSGDQFAGLADEETVRVRPVRARGKRSSIIPIVVTLLVITVIGGLVSLLAKYNNVFDVLAKQNQNVVTQTDPNTPVIPATDTVSTEPHADPEPLKVPKSFEALADAQSQNEQGTPEEKSTTPSPTGKATEGSAAKPEGSMAKPEGSTTKPEGSMVKPEGSDGKTDGSSEKPPAEILADAPEVSDADRAAGVSIARVAANMIHAAFSRRDIPAAKSANQRIKRLASAEFLDAQTKSLLEKQASQNEQMISHLDVFLSQLKTTANELPGGHEVKVGKLIMALVDAGPTEVTLRRAGRNEAIPYTDLPTSVAIMLGDMGSKKNVPKWNMAKAADLTIQAQHSPALREAAEPFLAQSISDGYDVECQAISDYSDIMWRRQHLPQQRTADPTEEEANAQLKEFRAASGYKNPNVVKSALASELIEKLLFSLDPKPEARLARLYEAITIAARHKEFDGMLAATCELYELADLNNFADSVVKPINLCMRTDMSAAEARHLVHTIIAIVRQHSDRQRIDEKAKAKLLRHAQTLVEEFQFSVLAPRVEQLAEQ